MPQNPPDGAEARLQWLVDRAEIGDLLTAYALGVDAKNWPAIAALFTDDGVIESPLGSFPASEYSRYAGAVVEPFWATHHMITNHAVTIDGDRATSRAYLQAIHLSEPSDPMRHADIGGWYDHEYVRVDGRWRVAKMVLGFVWTDGESLAPPELDG
ncbi:nuclear transport factor 2 family protein [Mycobacterium sp. E1747]|uniref:nuclear transport factor 2 family protein n=1 Tax=Mycobacterium sp. E1747 TaxID=1834128 RepID=UPI0007FBA9D1|nr:nuclear transport factor 2 family protein [Mycobacterium sp. E1747]OBH11156.1 hypothetical protein A5695_20325 [Mycobacterium sp. E1747]